MEAKHTPGPWEAKTRGGYLGSRFSITSPDGDIADIRYNGLNERDGEANAHLLAAAPELLQQLKSVLAVCEITGEIIGDMVAMRAAVAKAEGREP